MIMTEWSEPDPSTESLSTSWFCTLLKSDIFELTCMHIMYLPQKILTASRYVNLNSKFLNFKLIKIWKLKVTIGSAESQNR